MTNFGSTHTTSQVAEAVKRQFGDESGVQIVDADIVRWVNEAQELIALKNKALKGKSVLYTVANTGYIFYPSNVMQIESLHIDGARVRNMAFTEAEEYVLSADPQKTARGKPDIWYEWGGIVNFWPVPDAVWRIDLYASYAPVSASMDTVLNIPDRFYQDVISYVLYKAYEMDEDSQNASAKLQQFENGLAEKLNEERTAQTMTYETITTYDW